MRSNRHFARAHHLDPHRILARLQHVLVGQHGLQAAGRLAIQVDRFGKQTPPQRIPAVEQAIDRAGLEVAEGGEQPLAAVRLIDGAGYAMADHPRIGADGVEPQQPLLAHLGQALGEEVLGAGEGVGHVPPLPIDEELLQALPIPLGVFQPLGAELFEVAGGLGQVHAAADAVLETKTGLSRSQAVRNSRMMAAV